MTLLRPHFARGFAEFFLRLWRRRIILCSGLALILSACEIPPTYRRATIEKVIKKICRDEFSVNVSVWLEGDTLWLYTPQKAILTDTNRWKESVSRELNHIFLSLRRVILSMDKPPRFYAFVVSDTGQPGYDVYFIGFVPDLVKFDAGLISQGENQEREVLLSLPNPEAVNDMRGSHVKRHDMTIGEFIALLCRQYMEDRFASKTVKDDFDVTTLDSNFYKGRLTLEFAIAKKKSSSFLPEPFPEAKVAVKKYLQIYSSYENVSEVQITDLTGNKSRIYSKRALFEGAD